jgi:CrcB protein
MKQVFLVGLGGFIGAVGRYKVGGFVLHHTADWKFPLSTFLVNVMGCFVIGLLSALVEKHDIFTPDIRVFLMPGVLGGFTTFSAFAHEGVFLVRRGDNHIALLYAILSVLCGLLAVWLGLKLVAALTPAP